MKDIFETKPDAVNKEGTSFWLDKDTTNYAKQIGLKNVKVLYLKTKGGYITRVIIENNDYVFENQRLEDIGVHLDMMRVIKEV